LVSLFKKGESDPVENRRGKGGAAGERDVVLVDSDHGHASRGEEHPPQGHGQDAAGMSAGEQDIEMAAILRDGMRKLNPQLPVRAGADTGRSGTMEVSAQRQTSSEALEQAWRRKGLECDDLGSLARTMINVCEGLTLTTAGLVELVPSAMRKDSAATRAALGLPQDQVGQMIYELASINGCPKMTFAIGNAVMNDEKYWNIETWEQLLQTQNSQPKAEVQRKPIDIDAGQTSGEGSNGGTMDVEAVMNKLEALVRETAKGKEDAAIESLVDEFFRVVNEIALNPEQLQKLGGKKVLHTATIELARTAPEKASVLHEFLGRCGGDVARNSKEWATLVGHNTSN